MSPVGSAAEPERAPVEVRVQGRWLMPRNSPADSNQPLQTLMWLPRAPNRDFPTSPFTILPWPLHRTRRRHNPAGSRVMATWMKLVNGQWVMRPALSSNGGKRAQGPNFAAVWKMESLVIWH